MGRHSSTFAAPERLAPRFAPGLSSQDITGPITRAPVNPGLVSPRNGDTYTLVIVGAGPSCTYVLERLAAKSRAASTDLALDIHIFERSGQASPAAGRAGPHRIPYPPDTRIRDSQVGVRPSRPGALSAVGPRCGTSQGRPAAGVLPVAVGSRLVRRRDIPGFDAGARCATPRPLCRNLRTGEGHCRPRQTPSTLPLPQRLPAGRATRRNQCACW